MQTAAGDGTFLAAAQQGMFAVDTAAGEQLVMSIKQMQTELIHRLERIHFLKTEAKLGDLDEAHAIASRDRQVASGDDGDTQSLEFVLQRFKEALQDAQQALEIGMRNYAEFEAQLEQDYRRIGRHG
ncbi:MAG: hypothetical protein ACRDRW_15675 [Pseudonocardiaceae bacterium]